MRFLRKSLTGLFLMSLTLGLLGYAAIMVQEAVQARLGEEPRKQRGRERVFSVNVVPAEFGAVTPVLTVFGEVQSQRTLELRAASGGVVMDLDAGFVDGGLVRQGQLLARIDPADAQSSLDRAESDLLDAQAEQREAERAIGLARDELTAAQEQRDLRDQALTRQKDLLTRNVGTSAAVETAELALSSARQAVLSRRQAIANAEARIDQAATRLRRSEIALAEAQRRLADTEIRAAFDGALSDVSVVAGRRVSVNEKLAQLVDPGALEVAFRVSTQQYLRLLDDAGALRPAAVNVTLDVFGTDIAATGRLTRESASVEAGQTGRLLFALMDPAPGFKPGDFVTVSLQEPELRRVARVPATALSAMNRVLVLGADDRLEEIPVQLERRQGDEVLIRARGLAGREIVTERTPLLGAGIKVKPLRASGQEAPKAPELVELSAERRAKLKAFVEANKRMPKEAKARILGQLDKDKVPATMVERLESRIGG
ncbi:MAG: HlyD family efflux transporter periplasmic adaptor subunit [Pelagimonas sp.]|jgi:RND family efflux transporter MFP subunit|nr:HlyD family efflux transporter periplasmic adaptor subunit [Pelagimonas sp.]